MFIDFSQFLYDSVEKVLFKADFFSWQKCEGKYYTSTQSEYTVYIICSRHSAMHNNLNTLEMKRVLELQPFIPNANRLNIWQLNNLNQRLKCILSKYKHFSQTNTQLQVELWESDWYLCFKWGLWWAVPPRSQSFSVSHR